MSKKITPKSLLKKETINNELDFKNISIDDLNKTSTNYNMLVSFLNTVSSCQISDAYNNIAGRSGVVEKLKSINNQRVFGRITTCYTSSDDWGTITLAIDEAKEGDILFIQSNNDKKAIWGELASTGAKSQNIAATAIYGSVRDLDALLYLDYPIFACNFRPNAGKALGLGKINIELCIGDFYINPGDFFFGDESGVVIIPKSFFNKVIIETISIKKKELAIIDKLNKKFTLAEITNLK